MGKPWFILRMISANWTNVWNDGRRSVKVNVNRFTLTFVKFMEAKESAKHIARLADFALQKQVANLILP